MTNPTVAFTTPQPYAARLSHLLTLKSLTPLWYPTILTTPTPQTLASLSLHLSPHLLPHLSAIAFPSRTAISAVSSSIKPSLQTPLLPNDMPFILAALGNDAELINKQFLLNFTADVDKIKIVIPPIATPAAMVKALGEGFNRRVLCPVPCVVGLNEPNVVPEFIRDLEEAGWVPVRVDAYETRWVGAESAVEMVEEGWLDAVVFTSSAEVEGLLKGLRELGWDWGRVRRRWPGLVVAAHGPVTAAGAKRLGVEVDVVSERFGSFDGVVEALDFKLRGLRSRCL